jgi:hypothetical protein
VALTQASGVGLLVRENDQIGLTPGMLDQLPAIRQLLSAASAAADPGPGPAGGLATALAPAPPTLSLASVMGPPGCHDLGTTRAA